MLNLSELKIDLRFGLFAPKDKEGKSESSSKKLITRM